MLPRIAFGRNVPRKPRLVGGVRRHNTNETSFPGSPALWAGSFIMTDLLNQKREGGSNLNQADRRVLKDRRALRDRRTFEDRRKQPSPASSRFMLWWQRRTLQREVDLEKTGYIDPYSVGLLFLIILIVGLDILDSLFTMMVLDWGRWEVHPMVRSVAEIYRDRFWVSKVAIISIPLILLCIHSKFRLAMSVIFGICAIKIGVLLYQVF